MNPKLPPESLEQNGRKAALQRTRDGFKKMCPKRTATHRLKPQLMEKKPNNPNFSSNFLGS
jgi:hypothetical protein